MSHISKMIIKIDLWPISIRKCPNKFIVSCMLALVNSDTYLSMNSLYQNSYEICGNISIHSFLIVCASHCFWRRIHETINSCVTFWKPCATYLNHTSYFTFYEKNKQLSGSRLESCRFETRYLLSWSKGLIGKCFTNLRYYCYWESHNG